MSPKTFTQVSVLIVVLVTFLADPGNAQAGGVCGGTYVVERGDTLNTIAARCGTTVSAIYAANPGISGYLYAGQALTLPGSNYANPCNCPPSGYGSTYIVRYGDTFSGIAMWYGVSVSALWSANPQIVNINYVYPGQVIYLPGSSPITIVPVTTEPPALSYGIIPAGTDYGKVYLSNRAKADAYVSLQGTIKDGSHIIKEYPVSGNMNAKIPAGWYTYVAWVGGEKFVGQFRLSPGADVTITFYRDKVVVQ